jgi:choice-of-anchor B domain-containing protein
MRFLKKINSSTNNFECILAYRKHHNYCGAFFIFFNMRIYFFLASLLFYTTAFTQNKNLQQLGKLSYGNVSVANLDGYTDSLGREYALVGTENGLSIVNISNPAAPVQVQFINGTNTFWREVRHYKNFAYITNEGGGGLQIVDLSKLPDSIRVKTIQPLGLTKSHTVFIDEKGIAYINGPNVGNGGTIFLNLEPDPWNPTIIGNFDNNYVHDCFARNDTLWAAHINDGFIKVIDVQQKNLTNLPQKTLATWSTPSDFSHNCWLDSSGKYLFTTDERENSFLACYDVSDLNNVTETDRIQHKAGSNAIIHNTYWMNDYCISSYYTEGITIHDVSRKHNIVEVGNFDTSPSWSGNQGGGFHGAWGVWSFLPSGNIIASDIEEGLYILKPTYKRACYLEGIVKDSVCGVVLNNVLIEILGSSAKDNTKITGSYATGIVDSGTYNIRFSRAGYATKTITNVELKNGVLTTLDVELNPISTVQTEIEVRDSFTGLPIPFTQLRLQLTGSNQLQYFETNASGKFTACDLAQGNYIVHSGKWAWRTKRDTLPIFPSTNSHTLILQNGYYDDFTLDYNWQRSGTAVAGKWVRAKPVGTTFQGAASNPGTDVVNDLNQECYLTGNNGTQAGDDDVDDGNTILSSPIFDLSNTSNPYISYYRWFFNDGGNGTPNDTFMVQLSNGIDTKTIELVLYNDAHQSQWKFLKHRVKDYMQPTANMKATFYTSDYASSGHLVEAGVDVFEIADTAVASSNSEIASEQIALKQLLLNGRKHIQITGSENEKAILTFTDILGRTVKQLQLKQHELIEVPNLVTQMLFATLATKEKRTTIKIY